MKLRKFTSIGLFFSTIVIGVTGVALFVVESSGKAYVEEVHESFGIAFLVFMLIHTVLNFKPLKAYFKKAGQGGGISRELTVNSIVAVALLVITLVTTEDMASQMANSTYPAVESFPLAVVLEQEGIDCAMALRELQADGYVIPQGEVTLAALAGANKQNPRVIYSKITSGAAR